MPDLENRSCDLKNAEEGAGTSTDEAERPPDGRIDREEQSPNENTDGDEQSPNETAQAETLETPRVPAALAWRLYTSHFLSTWNSRSFEFGAVLFLASIYPGTLLMLSIYALICSASAVVTSPLLGHFIDKRKRLPVVRTSILTGRTTVALSCVVFWIMYRFDLRAGVKTGLFCVVTALACVEKAASILNQVSVERDWVIVIARGDEPGLQKLNARMRRIDLFCKLAGPLFISLIDGASVQVAILLSVGLNVVSAPIEYFAIARVYNMVPALADPREQTDAAASVTPLGGIRHRLDEVLGMFKFYFKHRAFLPSFALSLLYFTVLSLGGQMVTYLLASGYNAFEIGLVRSLSVVLELSATWIAPRLMGKILPVRAGMWFLSWQMAWLGIAVAVFWAEPRAIVAASALTGGTIISRIGLWGYDLCAQVIVQTEVQAAHRGSFSSVEAAFQNLFDLLSYVTTIIWSRPSQFRWPTLTSAIAVYLAGLLFCVFLRIRRGHLVHVSCIKENSAEEHEMGD